RGDAALLAGGSRGDAKAEVRGAPCRSPEGHRRDDGYRLRPAPAGRAQSGGGGTGADEGPRHAGQRDQGPPGLPGARPAGLEVPRAEGGQGALRTRGRRGESRREVARARRARLHRAHGGAGRRRLPRRLEPLRDACDVSVVRRGRAALLRLDDLPGRRGGGPPRGSFPAAPPRRSLRAGDAAANRPPGHARRHHLRRGAGGRRHRHPADRPPPGHRRARDLHGLVLRRAAGGRSADDPVRAAAPLAARARPMILISLVFLVLLLIGVPVAVTVGAAGYVGALLASPAPLATGVQTILHQVDSFVLLSLPLFILAGALMETGGIARRLVALAVAMVGWVRGGLGMAVITAEYIFSGISGSTVADVSAVAATTIPGMVRAGYSKELAVAVVSAASAMGILVPPCILMILIGSLASLPGAPLFPPRL